MQGWYFPPTLKNYRVIKTVTDTGAIRLTDNFTSKNHAIKNPKFTPVERIVKATESISLTTKERMMHNQMN